MRTISIKVLDNPDRVLLEYEDFKRTYKETQKQCEENHICFTPVVFEAHGGSWSVAARRLVDFVAKKHQDSGYWHRGGCSLRIAQRLSTAVHAANARAVIKRLSQNQEAPAQVADLEAADDELDFWQ